MIQTKYEIWIITQSKKSHNHRDPYSQASRPVVQDDYSLIPTIRWRCSFFYKTIAGSVFCEVLHLEAICRKHDSTYQDVAFFRRHFVTFSRKKRWSRRWCLIHNKMWRLLEDVSLPSTGNKKVMREPLPYTGENVSTPSFLLPIMEVKNMLIRNVQVAHNFFTIVLYN